MPNRSLNLIPFLLLFLAPAIVYPVAAQEKLPASLRCIVLDSATQQPLEGATVFMTEKDGETIMAHAIADLQGKASLHVDKDLSLPLLVSIQMVGYEKKLVVIDVYPPEQNLGIIYLKTLYKDLKGVTVSGRKNVVKFDGNILRYDLEGIPGMKYMTTMQVLENMPFIQVTDEEIRMMGGPVVILIDDKPHPYYNNLKNLNSLPPQAIERIDMSIVGSGRYSGKVMNVRLKKNYFLGWNGNFNTGLGIYGGSAAARGGYWSNKFGIDASVNYAGSGSPGRGMSEIHSGITSVVQQDDIKNRSASGSLNTSVFYRINEQSTLDFGWVYSPPFQRTGKTISDLVYTDAEHRSFSQHSDLQSAYKSNAHVFSLNYTKDFKKSTRHFYILTNYQKGNFCTRIHLNQHQDADALLFRQFNNTDNDNREITAEVLYMDELKGKLSYSIGTKLIKRDYTSGVFTDTWDTTLLPGAGIVRELDNRYNQLVASSHADGEIKLKKLRLRGGLRFEQVSENYIEPIVFRNKYVNLIPNASVTYTLNEKNLLALSYSRRVSRPAFEYMTNVATATSAYVRDSGNAYLRPERTNNFGLQYYGNYKFGSLGLNFGFSSTGNRIDYEYYLPGGEGTIVNSAANIDRSVSYTLGTSLNMAIGKKIRFSHFMNASAVSIHHENQHRTFVVGYIDERLSYPISRKQVLSLGVNGYTANVSIQGKEWNYIRTNLRYSRYLDLFKANYPAQLSISLNNPFLFKGLLAYSRYDAPGFYHYTERFSANPFISVGFNISFSGKGNRDRTFYKNQSIKNDDIKRAE